MKIGILTFQRTSNFGSMLQAFALCKAVRDLGYDCDIVDYTCVAVEDREALHPKFTSLRAIAKFLLFDRKLIAKGKELLAFINKQKMLSEKRYSKSELKKACEAYDIFLVGSDIVWDPKITNNDLTFFLDFVPEAKGKIAFASSLGKEPEIGSEFWTAAFNNLKKFDGVAVREQSTAKSFSEQLAKNVEWVCDPTMLLSVEDWNLVTSEKYKEENYVLVYFNSGTALDDAIAYAKKINAKVYVINYGLPIKGTKNISVKTLEDFLSLIKYAKCVFTGSYHGFLFSIYFKRDFWFYNRAHAERMLSLAGKMGLLSRDRGNAELAFNHIDYQYVTPKVVEFRQQSLSWLKNAINKAGEHVDG